MNDIGKQIAKLRKNKGYTQEALAGILNVSSQAISKWENGRSLPETALLPILSKLFDCSINDILIPQNKDDTNILRIEFDKQTESIIKKVGGMLMNNSHIGFSDEQITRALCKAMVILKTALSTEPESLRVAGTLIQKLMSQPPLAKSSLSKKRCFAVIMSYTDLCC